MAMHATSGGNSAAGLSIFPFAAFEMFQQRSDLFDSVFSYFGQTETRLTLNRQATLGDCVYVSGSYFGALGIRASAGRVLADDDDRFGAPPVAMISAGFAQQWYGSPADAVGKAVSVNGASFTVVGVTPAGFFGVNPVWTPEIYVPLHSYPITQPQGPEDNRFTAESMYWLDVMARLKPGVTREQTQAALDPVFAEYFRKYSGETPEKARMIVLEGAGGLDSLQLRYSRILFMMVIISRTI
jgi:hypothetical protein